MSWSKTTAHRKTGTVAATDDDDQRYLFWSSRRKASDSDIGSGQKFIDTFFRDQAAYIGWDLFPKT